MSLLFICRRCRQRIKIRHLKTRDTGNRERRTFISLQAHEDVRADARPTTCQERVGSDFKKNSYNGRLEAEDSKKKRQPQVPSSINSMLESLFASGQREGRKLPATSRYSRTSTSSLAATTNFEQSLRDDFALMKRLLDDKSSAGEIWSTFLKLESFNQGNYKERQDVARLKVPEDKHVFHDILIVIVRERSMAKDFSSTPALSEVVLWYVNNGRMEEGWWQEMLWIVLGAVIKRLLAGTQKSGSLGARALEPGTRILLNDATEVLRLYPRGLGRISRVSLSKIQSHSPSTNRWEEDDISDVGPKRKHEHNDEPRAEDIAFPPVTLDISGGMDISGATIDAGSRLLQFLPGKSPSHYDRDMAIIVVLTHVTLHLSKHKPNPLRPSDRVGLPFRRFVKQMVLLDGQQKTDFKAALEAGLNSNGLSVSDAAIVLNAFEKLRHEKFGHKGLGHAESGGEKIGQDRSDSSKRFVMSRKSSSRMLQLKAGPNNIERGEVAEEIGLSVKVEQVRQAARDFDGGLVNRLWNSQVPRIGSPFAVQNLPAQILFAEFLTAFFAVGRPDRAIEVWNAMMNSRQTPTQRHWFAMLEGCNKERDLPSLISIWQRMKAAGVQPNNQAYTIYLGGLLRCRNWQTAFQTIEEMGQVWDSAKSLESGLESATDPSLEPDVNRLVPSIIPLNAAIAGFLATRKPDMAEAVRNWAQARNISADVTTYNTFLRWAVRADDSEQVQRLLKEMNDSKCQPNIVTFTIILDGHFRSPGYSVKQQSAAQQQELVARVFQDVAEHGIEASPHTYSVMVDGLLRSGSFNIVAAQAVLAHMSDQGIKPSPHISTILITHYFACKPPDLAAIDSLWRRMQLEKSQVDHVFYDRMIEGYGRIGEVDSMLSFLSQMHKAGKVPGWIALLSALRALVRVQEWELVKNLVRDVTAEEGLLKHGTRGWRGEREFWEMVEDLSFSGLDLPVPESPEAVD